MLITKCLLLFLFLYGKNTVKTTDKSVVPSPGFVACAGSGGVNGAFNLDWTVGVSAGRARQGLTYGAANGADEPADELKLFKDDSNNNPVEIKETDFYKDQYLSHLTYVFKKGVKCTLVKFGDTDVWKKGDEQVDEPRSVTYDSVLGEVAVRDAKSSVHFGMDSETRQWKHVVTYDRSRRFVATKRSPTANIVRPPRSRSSLPISVSLRSDLSSSLLVTKTASTGTPVSAGAPQEPLKAPEKADDGASTVTPKSDQADSSTVASGSTGAEPESGSGTGLRGTSVSAESSGEAEEPSTVAPEATDANEVSKHTGLRGTSPPTDTKEEADETASSTSGGAVTSEEKEKDSEDQEAGSDDGSFSPVPAEASESTDPGSTAGEGKVAQELAEGSTAQTSGGASQSGEENEEVDEAEGSQGGGVTAQTEADGGSGTDTSSGEGTQTADASADKGSGEGTGTCGKEDGGSQPSTTPPSGGTDLTSGPDGSSATPPPSSAGGASPDGGTEPETKTGVELSLKKTSGTNEFSYNKVGSTVTYTAKENYAFKSVKTKKGGCSGCCGSDVTIWEVRDPKEYSNKVVLEGKGDKNNKVVTIHLANESKVFKREGKGKPWSEVSEQGNQATGQPGSGTPASGSQGTTGGRRMSSSSQGMTAGDDKTGGRRMSSSSQGMTAGDGGSSAGTDAGHVAGGSGDAGSAYTDGSVSVTAGGSTEGTGLAAPTSGSGSSTRKTGSRAGSSAGSTAGSTAGSDVANLESVDSSGADGSSAAPEGSTASPDAGSIAADGSGHVAGGSDADGSAGSPADAGSSGDGGSSAGTDAGHVAGDDGQSGDGSGP